MLSDRQLERWREDRARQAAQHPDDKARQHGVLPYRLGCRGSKWSRGDHYRRKNTGIALRTYRAIRRSP